MVMDSKPDAEGQDREPLQRRSPLGRRKRNWRRLGEIVAEMRLESEDHAASQRETK